MNQDFSAQPNHRSGRIFCSLLETPCWPEEFWVPNSKPLPSHTHPAKLPSCPREGCRLTSVLQETINPLILDVRGACYLGSSLLPLGEGKSLKVISQQVFVAFFTLNMPIKTHRCTHALTFVHTLTHSHTPMHIDIYTHIPVDTLTHSSHTQI